MVCLVGPHGDPLELFKFTKEVLDKVTPFVNFGVNKQRLCAARVLRDDNFCASFMQVSNDAVSNVTAHPTPTNEYPNNAFRVASSTDRPVSFAVLPIDLKAA